ncbi:GyrI-like domain-containing protein [Clostridium sp. D2Q-14]|uniref:GyrI-like domain-containing protein n=1 Tax=Anaeromonas gelatinilytica TaxID=2683194 RepID=UPI00193C4E10|nr:GyrI-like domain-containing protein [Anaeromonas gelatinilytica]MBS4536542.1 GyrI-like domain-containing protein [Anaeromonas gelatinilytica]
MNYNIEIKNTEPITVATMSYNGPITEATKFFPKIFKAIKGKSNGAPFFCYHEFNEKTGIGKIELCVPTSEVPNANGITLKNLSPKKVVCLTHIGPYDTLPMAYETMHCYIQEHNLSVKRPWREVFIKGPGMILKGNPNKYITEILYPLKEEK